MLSKADMEISGIERCYKALSEFAHPNWSGTAFIYSQHHTDALYTSFGRNERNSMALAGTGINALQAALKLFQYGFNGFSDCFEDLVKKCEQHLDKSK